MELPNYETGILIFSSIFILICMLSGLYLKNKILLYLSLASGLLMILYCIYRLFFYRLPTTLDFAFTDDATYIDDGKIDYYCGDDPVVPDEYDQFGTRNKCLKKGIGIGMAMPDVTVAKIITKPPKANQEKTYCGNNTELPQGYDRFATRTECVRKGVGVGVRMPYEKRHTFQQRNKPSINKHEIYKLADRFKINTDQPRERVIEQISQYILATNNPT